MKIRKTTAKLMAFLLAVCMLATTALAYDGIYTDKEGNISYSPYEQGLYSNGGYTIDKVSHPTLGAGEVDGILTGDLQDRGQSYSWSMAEAGDYVYIGTCYNSTYYLPQQCKNHPGWDEELRHSGPGAGYREGRR